MSFSVILLVQPVQPTDGMERFIPKENLQKVTPSVTSATFWFYLKGFKILLCSYTELNSNCSKLHFFHFTLKPLLLSGFFLLFLFLLPSVHHPHTKMLLLVELFAVIERRCVWVKSSRSRAGAAIMAEISHHTCRDGLYRATNNSVTVCLSPPKVIGKSTWGLFFKSVHNTFAKQHLANV